MTEQTETRQRLSDSIEQRQLSIRAFLGAPARTGTAGHH